MTRFIWVILACLPLGACSWLGRMPVTDRVFGEEGMFRDRQGEYLEARTIPRTEIPQGLDSYVIDDLLVIPEVGTNSTQAFLDAPRPRPLEGRSDREVVIQRMGDRSWIVVDVSPSQVWPRIRDYWRQNEIDIAFEDPTQGVMDTGWFTLTDNVLTREKVRVVVETGFQNNSAEIRLLHQSAPQATPVLQQVRWPEESQDPAVEQDLLRALSSYLADVADLYQASSESFLARNISGTGKASLERDAAGNDILQLQAAYDRSWAAVGRALSRAGIEVNSQDDELGVYEVYYVPGTGQEEEDKPGFFARMNPFGGDDEPEPRLLWIEMQDSGEAIDVKVSPVQSTDDEASEAAIELLRLIRNTIA